MAEQAPPLKEHPSQDSKIIVEDMDSEKKKEKIHYPDGYLTRIP